MKKFVLLLTGIFQLFLVNAQPDHWTVKTSLTGFARMAGTGFSIGNKGYVGIGTDFNAPQSQLKDFWEYDPATDSYSQIADYPGGGVNGAGAFSIEDKGYVSCGAGNGNFYNDLWCYDTLANSWSQKASLPGPQRSYTFGFAVSGKGYIATGYNGSTDLADVWEYDPVIDSWTSKVNITQARSSASGFSIGNKGYLVNGYIAGGAIDCWEFDPSANTWTQKADVGTQGRSDGCAFSIGEYGYVCCGYINSMSSNDLWEYDADANTWIQRSSLPGSTRVNPIAFSIGTNGYVFGGSDPGFVALADMYEYTPDSTLISSVNSFESRDEWSFYPNPATDKVFLSIRNSGINSVRVFDESGTEMINVMTDKKNLSLDVSALSPGIYFLRPDDNRFKQRKLMIR